MAVLCNNAGWLPLNNTFYVTCIQKLKYRNAKPFTEQKLDNWEMLDIK